MLKCWTKFSRIFEYEAVQKCANNHNENNSPDQVDDGNVEAENRPTPKKKAEPKRAAKKVATKEPKKKAKSGGK